MFWKKSHVGVVILMVVAALFGCQCGGPAIKAPGPNPAPNQAPNPGNVPDAKAEADPAEKAGLELVNKFGGAKQEGGHVIEANMWKPGFTEADFKLLATLSKLKDVRMSGTNINGVGLKELVGLQDLAKLDIGQNQLSDAGLKEAFTLKQLKYLRFTRADEAALPGLAGLTQLEELMVDGCGFKDGRAAVNIATALPKLKRLSIGNNGIGDDGLAAIANMADLEELHMIGCRTSDKGLTALPKLKKLEKLSVGPRASDEGMKSIAACTSLRELRLFNTHATDKCLQELGKLPQLKELIIDNGVFGKVTDAGMAEFGKAHPNCKAKLEKF
jgi:hypothetical protein